MRLTEMIAGLVTKPKPFEVAIESRGPSYTALMKDAPGKSEVKILNFNDVVRDNATVKTLN